MRLGSTNETIELVTLTAQAVDFVASFVDLPASGASTAGENEGSVSLATTTTMVAAPAASIIRQVQLLMARNKGAAVQSVTVQKNTGGTLRVTFTASLMPGEFAEWSHNGGLKVYDTLGRQKVVRDKSETTYSVISRATLPINRASISSQIASVEASLWRGTGFPAQGAVPAAAAVCSDATVGAMPLPARSGAQRRIITQIGLAKANGGSSFIVEDRLAHMGGLNGTLTTAQTVGIDLSALGSNVAQRIGTPDYKEVMWVLEWYTATGATIATPTINCTFHDNTTGTANIWNLATTALPATVGASRRYLIVPPVGANEGKGIKSVQTAQLSVSTGTAGSFGVTAVRRLATVVNNIAGRRAEKMWTPDTAPEIFDNSCITVSDLCITTTTGTNFGDITISVVQ